MLIHTLPPLVASTQPQAPLWLRCLTCLIQTANSDPYSYTTQVLSELAEGQQRVWLQASDELNRAEALKKLKKNGNSGDMESKEGSENKVVEDTNWSEVWDQELAERLALWRARVYIYIYLFLSLFSV